MKNPIHVVIVCAIFVISILAYSFYARYADNRPLDREELTSLIVEYRGDACVVQNVNETLHQQTPITPRTFRQINNRCQVQRVIRQQTKTINEAIAYTETKS